MTDAEIEALARELLNTSLAQIVTIAPAFVRSIKQKDGTACLELLLPGTKHGSIHCVYQPLTEIKKLIAESGRLFDSFVVTLTDKQTGEVTSVPLGEYIPEHRDQVIKATALAVTLTFLGEFMPRFTEMMIETSDENVLITNAMLAEIAGGWLDSDQHVHGKGDMRKQIEHTVATAADRKRTRLRNILKAMPNITAAQGPGRLPKSESDRVREAAIYRQQVANTYRNLRLEKGKPPKKIHVARELGEGGVNPKSGGESSAQAFAKKLERLRLDYKEIAQDIEKELNNNS